MAFSPIKMACKEEEQGEQNKKQVNLPGSSAATLEKKGASAALFS